MQVHTCFYYIFLIFHRWFLPTPTCAHSSHSPLTLLWFWVPVIVTHPLLSIHTHHHNNNNNHYNADHRYNVHHCHTPTIIHYESTQIPMDFILQHTSAHMFSSFFLQIHCLYVFWIWYCAENTSFPLLLIKPKFCEENLRYIRILANHKLVFHLTTPESDISIVRMMMIIDHSWSTYGNTWLINSSR